MEDEPSPASSDRLETETSPGSSPPSLQGRGRGEADEGSGSLLCLQSLGVRNSRQVEAVQNVSLEVRAGEIVGVAGVDGSGQREHSEAIVGIRRTASGQILLDGQDIAGRSVRQRQRAGVAYVPEDRHRAAMILDFSIAENYLLGHETRAEWGGGPALHPRTLAERAARMVSRWDVRGVGRGVGAPVRTLSGGNQQKIVVARALDAAPRLLVACQPTRGLDVAATESVYNALRVARDEGLAILLFSLDLDEIFTLSDRIAVMYNGQIVGVLARDEATPERVGALMTGARPSLAEGKGG